MTKTVVSSSDSSSPVEKFFMEPCCRILNGLTKIVTIRSRDKWVNKDENRCQVFILRFDTKSRR